MARTSWLATVAVAAALCGCGGGGTSSTASVASLPADPPSATTRPNAPTPAPPTTPPVVPRVYFRALDRYCTTTVDAISRLARSKLNKKDPEIDIARLARTYRAGLERFALLTPPSAFRSFHLLTLATGRESADRLDLGVKLGRGGDTDAATDALSEISGLLPASFPPAIARGAPACAEAVKGS